MRSLPVVIAMVAGSMLVGAGPAGAQTVGPTLPVNAAKDACTLVTSEEITQIFGDAPLDPGPTKVRLPKSGYKNFSQCLWDDEKTDGPVPQLIARTSLARNINKAQKKFLTTPHNSSVRKLTGEDLEGLGSKATIEINDDGSYASVAALKGDDYYIVSVGYVGAAPYLPITDLEIITLTREAAKRV